MARRSSTIDVDNLEDLDSPSTEDIETGSLTIKDDSREIPQKGSCFNLMPNEAFKFCIRIQRLLLLAKDFWKRATPLNPLQLSSDDSTVLRFEVPFARIVPPEGKNVKVKRYVVYDLAVRQDSSVMDPNPTIIQRRYTDFRNLYLALKRTYPTKLASVYFPSKVLIGNFNTDIIAERSAAFEAFLQYIVSSTELMDSPQFLHFLQDIELTRACRLLDERRNETAIPLLENSFKLLNKIFMDRSKPVLLLLCRLVAACTTSPVPHSSADRWANLALARYDTLCDIDLLPLYIPLLHTCAHLWWQRGRDQKPITDRLTDMSKKGINIQNGLTLIQAIHKLDPRTETV